jgi:OOP family OmpA-OmpF porin
VGCPLDGDLDGVADGIDRCPETPPADLVDEWGCSQLVLVLRDVHFDFDQFDLRADTRLALDRVADSLRRRPGLRIEIAGHTDSSGTEEYNMRLSLHRANAVRDYLVERGIDAGRLSAKGYGESVPVETNDTEVGQARNRRVELRRLD